MTLQVNILQLFIYLHIFSALFYHANEIEPRRTLAVLCYMQIFALTAEPIRFFAVSLWSGKFPACAYQQLQESTSYRESSRVV